MSKVLRWYLGLLEKHPWKTQSITTGVILASGDLICQVAVEKKPLKGIELLRTGRFALVGAVYVGPCLRGWYMVLEKLYGSAGKTAGLKKLITDQAVFAPTFLVGILSFNSLLRGETLNDIKGLLKRVMVKLGVDMYTSLRSRQLSTRRCMVERVLFVNFVALFFNTYLSWKTNSQEKF